MKKDNFGCFENKYFFYLYIFDLKSEPKISFNLPLISPKNTNDFYPNNFDGIEQNLQELPQYSSLYLIL